MHFINDYANQGILCVRLLKVDFLFTRKNVAENIISGLFLSLGFLSVSLNKTLNAYIICDIRDTTQVLVFFSLASHRTAFPAFGVDMAVDDLEHTEPFLSAASYALLSLWCTLPL